MPNFMKIPKDTLVYWLVRIMLVLLPAAAGALGAIQVAKIEASTAKLQAEAGYKTSVERIEELENIQDELTRKVAVLEGELIAIMAGSRISKPEPVAAASPKLRVKRAPMPVNLEKAVELQEKR